MSGPKYYNFPLGSPEEAAGIYAQLSAFQHGVKIKVVNNQLQFTVSENAWYRGATYSSIQSEIAKARKRYEDNEELKRLLEENKEKERAKIKAKLSGIDDEYRKEKTKLQRSISRCSEIMSKTVMSYTTPFGTYDLSAELCKIRGIESAMRSELTSLDERRKQCIEACQNARSAIDNCTSMQSLASVQRTIFGIRITSSNVADSIDDIESSIKEKAFCLKKFVSFLNKLYEGMKDKDLMGYFDRIKKEVATIDIFDVNAQKKIEKILAGIESEISLLREKEISAANSREIKEKVTAQLKLLDDFSSLLKPVLESIVVENETTANYTRRSAEIIKESDEIISRINGLEFVNGENQAKVLKIVNDLLPLRNSTMSKATIDKLQTIIADLHTLEGDCKRSNEIYQQFKEEYRKYEELYVRLQGFLSADGSEVEVDEDDNPVLCSPIELILAYDNPEAQIKELKQKNAELTEVLNGCAQEGVFGAVSAAIEKESWGESFKKEKHKDGSLHLTYVRRESKGAIFDVDCGINGSVGIYPRGVVLCNGRTTITPEELQKVHSSCSWADEIHSAFGAFGMSHSGSYEEMPAEVMQSLYDIKNYFHISSFDESVKFLQISGYSIEEIETLLEIERVVDPQKRKRQRDIIAAKALAIKK